MPTRTDGSGANTAPAAPQARSGPEATPGSGCDEFGPRIPARGTGAVLQLVKT